MMRKIPLESGLLAALLLLYGCGGGESAKGPELPYTPTEPVHEPLPRVLMKTTQGDMEIELFEDDCPNIVANFITLAERKFYDGLLFHRIIRNFCVQGGDPKGDGSGGPGYRLPPEFYENPKKNLYGTLAMAKPGNIRDQSGSQFFFNINKRPQGNRHLDGKHVVFGKVVKGLDVLKKLGAVKTTGPRGNPPNRPLKPQKIIHIQVLRKRAHPYVVRNKILVPETPKPKLKPKPAKKDRPDAKPEKTKASTPKPLKTGKKNAKTEAPKKTGSDKAKPVPKTTPDEKPK